MKSSQAGPVAEFRRDRLSLVRQTMTHLGAGVLFLVANAPPVQASFGSHPGICETAAIAAANATGVPPEVMLAIALVETGRRGAGEDRQMRPWPWAVNQAGEAKWFDSREQAIEHVQNVLADGKTNVDLGCFQLNYRWHADRFASLDAMIDPKQNAIYAARFLLRLFETHSDWSSAAGAYHSGTPEYAERYRKRFDTVLAGLLARLQAPNGQMQAEYAATSPESENPYPLLRIGAQGSRGSLVPLLASGRRLIGEQP